MILTQVNLEILIEHLLCFGTVLGTGDRAVNELEPCSCTAYLLMGEERW